MTFTLFETFGLSLLPSEDKPLGGIARPPRITTLDVPMLCPLSSGLKKAAILDIAEKHAAAYWDTHDNAFDRIMAMLDVLGGEIRSSGIPQQYLLVAEDHDRFVITLTNPWDLSVALGHLFLHFPVHRATHDVAPMAVPNYITLEQPIMRARTEANLFATSFLMPAAQMQALWAQGGVAHIAKSLRLSPSMVAARAAQLGLAG